MNPEFPAKMLLCFFDSFDGVTYFFLSSGIFVLLIAALFFTLGIWIGALTWGRFKRRFFDARDTIEEMKTELAMLKRRAAEQATRPRPQQQPSPAGSAARSVTLPAGRGFTIWTAEA